MSALVTGWVRNNEDIGFWPALRVSSGGSWMLARMPGGSARTRARLDAREAVLFASAARVHEVGERSPARWVDQPCERLRRQPSAERLDHHSLRRVRVGTRRRVHPEASDLEHLHRPAAGVRRPCPDGGLVELANARGDRDSGQSDVDDRLARHPHGSQSVGQCAGVGGDAVDECLRPGTQQFSDRCVVDGTVGEADLLFCVVGRGDCVDARQTDLNR
jgi:hypothetical protein